MEEKASESASATVRRMEKGSHEWVVENYSLHKGIGVNKAIESEEFIVGGHRWMIRLFPDGKRVEAYNVGDASLFISLRSENSDPVRFLYELYVLDQSGKGIHWGHTLFEGKVIACLRPGINCGKLHFIKRASLESPDYLKDDCLKFRCTIGVLTSQIQKLPLINVPKSNIGADFGKLLESKQGADVFFKVANERFCAHKWILTARSPVFRSRLKDCHQPQEIVIPDMESRIFKAMLRFIYTGTLPEEEQEAVSDSGSIMLKSFMGKMLAAADQFELKRLKKICESHILERVSEESVAYLLHLADLCHATELKAACLRFAAENQDAVMESDGCEYLKEICPSLFLELAGYKENPSSSGAGELDFCRKILSAVKESFVGIFWSQNASDMKHKIKEA
ncbi:hypothetical protein Pfo_010982 [Paulownia fortunei]|nr:hypothetical protein Pfo_010982 [Paulownia fortunei]